MTFLPTGYKAPKSMSGGYYMKLQAGQNKFRVLSDAITGYEIWVDGKPVRSRDYPKSIPAGFDSDSGIKHFWAMVVWNYTDERVQILEITQATIRDQIHNLYTIEDFGEPTGYDIIITRTGEKLNTEYAVQGLPPKPIAGSITSTYERMKVNLDALFDGGNPFEDTPTAELEEVFDDQPKMPSMPKSIKKGPTV